MNLLDAAERLASIEGARVQFAEERCLYSISDEAACAACLRVCPTEALTWDGGPRFNPDRCVNCLACLPVCPTGSFAARKQLSGLIRCVTASPSAEIEIACEFRQDSDAIRGESAPLVWARGCLAGLGTGTLLSLIEAGAQTIVLRCDACEGCPHSDLFTEIETQVSGANQLLSSEGAIPIRIAEEPPGQGDLFPYPVMDVENPPLSRRELFQLTALKGPRLAVEALAGKLEERGKSLGLERMRLNASLQRLAARDRTSTGTSLQHWGYANVTITEDCTACASCARICPTGAIGFIEQDESFRLEFSISQCIDCRLCVKVCFPDAIAVSRDVDLQDILGCEEPTTVLEGTRQICGRCRSWFLAIDGAEFCQVCEFRTKNPFGSRMPKGRIPPSLIKERPSNAE